MSIGSYKNGSYERESFHGDLNDIRVFRSGLSQAQVKELKNGIQLVQLLSYLVKIVMKMKLYTKKNLVKNTICLIFIESN